MDGVGEQLRPDLRRELETALARLADEGHIPGRGERDIRFRIDDTGRIRWFEGGRVRVPASELGSDQTTEP